MFKSMSGEIDLFCFKTSVIMIKIQKPKEPHNKIGFKV